MNAYYDLQTSGNNSVQSTPISFPRGELWLPSAGPRSFSLPRQGSVIFEKAQQQLMAFQVEYETMLEGVRRAFVIPPDGSVVTFLNEHPTIPQILLEAATHLRASFPVETVFNLRVPIDESGSRTLYAVAAWPGDVLDVRAALARFDETWWISHSRQAAGYLAFTYELV